MSAGYSPNPLIKKLGIMDGYTCLIIAQPDNYIDLLAEIPPNAQFTDDPHEKRAFNFIHVFVTDLNTLVAGWPIWKDHLDKSGMLWISWPKQSSEIATNLNGNIVREFGLKGGLVDIKVCAVDHNWSGLKFVWRKEDR